MLKTADKQQLQKRLSEVINSIALLESTHPEHPALYHLKSERKWMEQRLKSTFWYKLSWRIKSIRGVFLMSTIGFRIWFQTRVLRNATNRVLFFLTVILLATALILYQGRRLYGWDLFPNSDSPIDEWILGN